MILNPLQCINYHIHSLFGGDFNLANIIKITKLTVHHY